MSLTVHQHDIPSFCLLFQLTSNLLLYIAYYTGNIRMAKTYRGTIRNNKINLGC